MSSSHSRRGALLPPPLLQRLQVAAVLHFLCFERSPQSRLAFRFESPEGPPGQLREDQFLLTAFVVPPLYRERLPYKYLQPHTNARSGKNNGNVRGGQTADGGVIFSKTSMEVHFALCQCRLAISRLDRDAFSRRLVCAACLCVSLGFHLTPTGLKKKTKKGSRPPEFGSAQGFFFRDS